MGESFVILRRTVVTCFLLVLATPASAQPAGTQAQELYDQGRALVASGKTVEGCAAFDQSQKLEPEITTLIALATCRERLGQLATARKLFLEAEQQTRSASDRTTAQLHQIALDRAGKLELRLSKLTIRVPDKIKIDGLEIWRDKERIPAEEWNQALPLDGGTYTITARAPGAEEWSTQIALAFESDDRTVDIPELRKIAQKLDDRPNAPAARHPAVPPEPSDPLGPRGIGLPIAVGAGAAVLLGGALGFSLWGDSTYDDAKAEMMDQARRDALEGSANRKRYAAQGFAIAGVGCTGVAVWLYLRHRSTRADATSSRAGQVMIAPTASGIGVVGRF